MLGRAHESPPDERVETGQGLIGVEPARGGGKVEVERVARDGGAVEQHPGRRGQGGALGADGRDDAAGRLGPGTGARQLLEQQRVAPGPREHALAVVRVVEAGQQGLGGFASERAEVERGGGTDRQQPLRHVARTERGDKQVRPLGRAPHQVLEQFQRGRVGPVDVVEDESERMASRKRVKPVAQPTVQPPSLGWRRGRRERHVVEWLERLGHRREGDVALQLGRPAPQHREAAFGRPVAEPVEQAGLADAGLAAHQQHGALPAGRRLDQAADRVELRIPSDQVGP